VERGGVCAAKDHPDDDRKSTSAGSAAQNTADLNQNMPYESYPSYANASPWPKIRERSAKAVARILLEKICERVAMA
jgi:hypothetical protein